MLQQQQIQRLPLHLSFNISLGSGLIAGRWCVTLQPSSGEGRRCAEQEEEERTGDHSEPSVYSLKHQKKWGVMTPKPTQPAAEPPDLSLSSNTKILVSKGHASSILQGFEHFRSDETLCDVTLESGDGLELLPVHRVIMASASEHFRTLFSGAIKAEGVVKLQGVSGRGLRSIVDFVYTGGLRLDMDSLRDTLEAANQLQMLPVLQLCSQLLGSELTVDNCVEVDSIAGELQLEEAQCRVKEFVCANFSPLVQSGRYLQLSLSCLSHALSSDSLRGFTEAELYRLACDWLDQDQSARGEHVYAVMSHVRFALMPPDELLRISQTDNRLRGNPACAQLLLEASTYQTLPFLRPILALRSERMRLRSGHTHLLLLGGLTPRHTAVSRQFCFYDDEAEVWRRLRPMEEPRYQHSAALLGGFLFVVGGQGQYDSKAGAATDSAFRYDPREDRWLHLAPLKEKRTSFHLSALSSGLYAVGGRNSSGELDSVERYDFSKNEWVLVCPMSVPLHGHAGAVLHDLIYISGGISSDSFQNNLSCYDPATDEWRQCASMAMARGWHCMSEVGGRLLVVGGNAPKCGSGGVEYADVLSVEFYCPLVDQWSTAAPMPLGQSDAGVVVLGEQVFVLGGYQCSGRCVLDSVQCYDPQRNVWEEVFGVPEPMGGACACAMPLPVTDGPLHSHAHDYPLDMPPS
ncbi:hypothetical protein GJAV_G00259750 [Gymnothorax javanicus]|nr:hypothetical protein GJAV_G00259750 [Gymnothorax javanicus]